MERTVGPDALKGKKHEKVVGADRSTTRTRIARWLRWAAGPVLVASLAVVVGYYALDRELKLSLEIEYCVAHQLWDEVLVKARNLPLKAYSQYLNHDVNLAPYHTGRLTDRMFAYPQRYLPLFALNQIGSDLFMRRTFSPMRKPCDFLLELGASTRPSTWHSKCRRCSLPAERSNAWRW